MEKDRKGMPLWLDGVLFVAILACMMILLWGAGHEVDKYIYNSELTTNTVVYNAGFRSYADIAKCDNITEVDDKMECLGFKIK